MNIPFIYGKIADKENFTDRVTEQELLYQSFFSLVNTVIISPPAPLGQDIACQSSSSTL